MLYLALFTLILCLIELIIRRKELEQEQKDHKNTKQYKYRTERARKERDALKKQNAELQEFVIFANKVISESDYAVKKEYKNSKV